MKLTIKPNFRHSQQGLTLMEVLVSLTIFSVLVSIAAATYVQASTVARQNRAVKLVMEEANFLLDSLSKDIRNNSINYSFYGGNISNPVGSLHLIMTDGTQKSYDWNGKEVEVVVNGEQAIFNSDQVVIERLDFYVLPTSAAGNRQEHVTVVLDISSNLPEYGAFRNISRDFQTTFASRNYEL